MEALGRVTAPRGVAWLTLGLLLLLLSGSPALAEQATGAETAALANRAAHGDASALARLRAIDRVDGQRVRLALALPATTSEPGARARLRQLARDVTAARSDAGRTSAEARDVLSADRFGARRGQGPLYGVAHAVGTFFVWLTTPLRRLGPLWWLPLAALLVIGVATVVRAVARRSRSVLRGTQSDRRDARSLVDPAALEREAHAAERLGDHDRALRLSFEAGLVRLDRAGVIRLRTSTTSGAVRSTLGRSRFDPLADTHDDVVYGERRATGDDLAAARAAWPRLLDEVGRR